MSIEEMVDTILLRENGTLNVKISFRLDEDDYAGGTALIKDHFRCDDETAEQCLMAFKEKVYDPLEAMITPEERERRQLECKLWERKLQTMPKCPTCGSTDLKKISGTAKAAGALTFGLFSKTARSQFQCKNCGYKW